MNEADPAWAQSRYYQDAAIRAAFERIILDRKGGTSPRVLLPLATGAGKTIIATDLLWRLSQAGQLPKPALLLCDRDEFREQAYTKLKAAFGDNARIVRTERGGNAAQNARASTSPPTRCWASATTNAADRPGESGPRSCVGIRTRSTSV